MKRFLFIAVASFLAFATFGIATAQEAPSVHVEVTDEVCGEAELLFVNESDETVQFELRIDGEPGGVFTVAANDDGEWTQEFDELLEYRVLPEGPYIVLSEGEECPPELEEPITAQVDVAVVEVHCGSLDLLFTNESSEVVQFELRANGNGLGVYTVASGDADEWTEEFDEGAHGGSAAIDYRLLPDGEFIDLAEVSTVCEEPIVEPTPEPCECPEPVVPTPVVIEYPVPVTEREDISVVVDNDVTVNTDVPVSVVVQERPQGEATASYPTTGKITPPATGSGGLK